MEFPAVGDPKDARKLIPISSLRWEKCIKGAVTNPNLYTHPFSTKNSIIMIPSTVGGMILIRYSKAEYNPSIHILYKDVCFSSKGYLVSIQECKDNKSYKERCNTHDNSSQRIARKMNEKEK
ncbi:MAG: hypothetical protein C5S33_00665 [ANME-2 cluster archaeon]|jgi:hypothetical protein|nr:hypothetical protein [ANME-2 cluster archaeon]